MSPPTPGNLDPEDVTTIEQFALLLRRLHLRAGKPTLRQLEKWAQAQNAAGRREVYLTRTSISDALNGRRLPRKEFVRWFTEACSVPIEQREIWLKAWERVADHHFVSSSATNPTPPTESEELSSLPGGAGTGLSSIASRVPATFENARFETNSARIEPHANTPEGIQIQPVFVDLLVVTVFMKGRSIHRRVTERLVTAQADEVAYFIARGFVGNPYLATFAVIKALWGCEAEVLSQSQPGWPGTRLRFPAPLRTGAKAHFASEMIVENDTKDRDWIDVYVDHQGIARGETAQNGSLPIGGLTIRVRFDDGYLPKEVWWYENLNEGERHGGPPDRHDRRLMLTGRDAQYTFIERSCETGENFGLTFEWPDRQT